MRRRFCRFIGLSSAERNLLLHASLLLCVYRAGLWCLPFGFWRKRRVNVRAAGSVRRDQVLWAIEAAGARMPGARCAARALAAQSLLARNGFESTVRVGVAKRPNAGFQAHAWLESGGEIVLGASDEPFVPLFAIAGEAR